jgi:hypothetical protein
MNTAEIKLGNVSGMHSTPGNIVRWQELVGLSSSKWGGGGNYQFFKESCSFELSKLITWSKLKILQHGLKSGIKVV